MKFQNPLSNAKLERYPAGHITQFFGENVELYRKAIGMPGHPGIDIYQPYGTPIIAPYDGKITGAHLQEAQKIGGNQIDLFSEVQTDGLVYETIYAHCSEILVGQGQRVRAGEPIGRVGNSGFVISGGIQYWQNSNLDNRGTHLHFGLRLWKPLRLGDMESLVIQNADNGFNGWVDPLPYLIQNIKMEKLKLIRKKNTNDVFFRGEDGIYRRIANQDTFNDLRDAGIIGAWYEIEEVAEINEVIKKTVLVYDEE